MIMKKFFIALFASIMTCCFVSSCGCNNTSKDADEVVVVEAVDSTVVDAMDVVDSLVVVPADSTDVE